MLVNMHAAKTPLSKLVARVADGEEIIIGRAGRPIAQLIPYVERRGRRTSGALKGKVWIAEEFDDAPDDLLDAFEGR